MQEGPRWAAAQMDCSRSGDAEGLERRSFSPSWFRTSRTDFAPDGAVTVAGVLLGVAVKSALKVVVPSPCVARSVENFTVTLLVLVSRVRSAEPFSSLPFSSLPVKLNSKG